jgi:hypothetical protein
MPASVKRNPLPIAIGIGVFVFLCVCVATFWLIDANSLWCTFFPFLGGCP